MSINEDPAKEATPHAPPATIQVRGKAREPDAHTDSRAVPRSWHTSPVLACVDAHYGADRAASACLVFDAWESAAPRLEIVERWDPHAAPATLVEPRTEPAPYVPGELYRRELPLLLAVLARTPERPEVVVVDGYVTLSPAGKPGLGAHLHDALGGRAVVVGVAKSRFRGAAHAREVLRGGSTRPLFVTAAGVDADHAAEWIRRMVGEHRIPDLLRRVDALCRGAVR